MDEVGGWSFLSEVPLGNLRLSWFDEGETDMIFLDVRRLRRNVSEDTVEHGQSESYSVFISYSPEDESFIDSLLLPVLSELQISYFLDKAALHGGDEFSDQLEEARRNAPWFLMVVSTASTDSEWARRDAEWAIKERLDRLICIVLPGAEPSRIHPGLATTVPLEVNPDDPKQARERLMTLAEIIRGGWIESDEQQSKASEEPVDAAEDAGERGDPLVERLLERRLAISTVATTDITGAAELADGPTEWGLGPSVDAGDFLLIYFPKGLARKMQSQGSAPQPDGLRYILRAAAASVTSDDSSRWLQTVPVGGQIELAEPISIADIDNDSVLKKWKKPGGQYFRNAGRNPALVRRRAADALWRLILERNPDVRESLEGWTEPAPTEEREETADFVLRNLVSRDTWTTDDKLGYRLYAHAITEAIFNGATQPPLTIGIQAPWGQGKTSLMRMIQERFDAEAPRRDERKLGRNGEIAVHATYARFMAWLREFGGPREDGTGPAENDDTGIDRVLRRIVTAARRAVVEVIDLLPLGPGAAPATHDELGPTTTDWQTEPMDELPTEPGEPTRLRRPGLLIHPGRRVPTVWFNPLYYRTSEQVWAGLAHAMLQQLAYQIDDPVKREQFWLRLQLARVNVDAVLHDVRKTIWLRFVPNAVKYAVLGTVAVLVAVSICPWAWIGTLGAGLVGPLHYFALFQKQAEQSWSLDRQFEKYVTEPDYQGHLGLLYLVDHDIDRALDLLCGEYPAAIFIDDLDRCDPETVSEIIFAINQFLSLPRRNVFFFLGMDMEMVASALGRAPGAPRVPTPSTDADHQSFGWRFMEKFVQLPFVIPHLDEITARRFVSHHLGDDQGYEETSLEPSVSDKDEEVEEYERAETVMAEVANAERFDDLARLASEEKGHSRQQSDRVRIQEAFSKRATELMADPASEEIRQIIDVAIDDLDLNPRTIKRYFGLVRILRNLQVATGTLTTPHRDRLLVLRAAHMLLNWPEAVQWLRRQSVVLTGKGTWVPVVSHVESVVATTPDWSDWAAMWQKDRTATIPTTFRDPRLYTFLRKIGTDAPGLTEMYDSRLF